MRIGTGVQNKIMEAMSMGLPCITTSLSAKPLGVKAGSDLEVGDSAEMLAQKIVQLLYDKEKATMIAMNGTRFVNDNYSVNSMNSLLNECIGGFYKT